MEPFVYGGKEVQFFSITGRIAGSSKSTETHVSGGGSYVSGGQTRVRPVTTTVVNKQEFFIQLDDGREVPYQLSHSNIPVRDGHIVSMISGTLDGRTSTPLRLVNHVTREFWGVEDTDICLERWNFIKSRLVRTFSGATLGVLIFVAIGGLFVQGLAIPCALPFLITLPIVVRWEAHARRLVRLLDEHCNGLAQAMLAGPPPTGAAFPQSMYAPSAAPAPSESYYQPAAVNGPAPGVQFPLVNPLAPSVQSAGSLKEESALRGRLDTGGALVAGGAASWLAHSILMLLGSIVLLIGLFGAFSGSVSGAIAASGTVFVAYIGATIAVLIAAFLIGSGLIVYSTGTGSLQWINLTIAARHGVSSGTRNKALISGVVFLVYGVVGLAAVVGLVNLMSLSVSGSTGSSILTEWILASILLIVAAVLFTSFTHALRAETGSLDSVGGTGLLAYSITNLVAVLLLVIPLRSGAGAGLQAAIVVLIGAVMALMVIPIIGIVIFSLMIGHGMRLRKIRARATMPSGPSIQPVFAMPFYEVAGMPAPSGRAQPGPAAAPPTVAAPESVVAGPGKGGGWVVRIQSQLDDLEKAMRDQKDFLLQLDRGLMEGRIENPVYQTMKQSRLNRIAELETEIADKRRMLEQREPENR